MRISDWSSDVCSSDLTTPPMSDAIQRLYAKVTLERGGNPKTSRTAKLFADGRTKIAKKLVEEASEVSLECVTNNRDERSEEHTSELQSLMRISYAVFCLKKKKQKQIQTITHNTA